MNSFLTGRMRLALSVSDRSGKQAREAGTEKSGVSGISLSRAAKQFGLTHVGRQAECQAPFHYTPPSIAAMEFGLKGLPRSLRWP
jgi:hypothetical protein